MSARKETHFCFIIKEKCAAHAIKRLKAYKHFTEEKCTNHWKHFLSLYRYTSVLTDNHPTQTWDTSCFRIFHTNLPLKRVKELSSDQLTQTKMTQDAFNEDPPWSPKSLQVSSSLRINSKCTFQASTDFWSFLLMFHGKLSTSHGSVRLSSITTETNGMLKISMINYRKRLRFLKQSYKILILDRAGC